MATTSATLRSTHHPRRPQHEIVGDAASRCVVDGDGEFGWVLCGNDGFEVTVVDVEGLHQHWELNKGDILNSVRQRQAAGNEGCPGSFSKTFRRVPVDVSFGTSSSAIPILHEHNIPTPITITGRVDLNDKENQTFFNGLLGSFPFDFRINHG